MLLWRKHICTQRNIFLIAFRISYKTSYVFRLNIDYRHAYPIKQNEKGDLETNCSLSTLHKA